MSRDLEAQSMANDELEDGPIKDDANWNLANRKSENNTKLRYYNSDMAGY